MMSSSRSLRWTLATALAAAVACVAPLAFSLPVHAAVGVETDPNDGVPRTPTPPNYTMFPATVDPGRGSDGYFEPKWFDTDGRHIQAHSGQIVTAMEGGQKVYYWYGEDRSLGYWNSPGVGVYRSTDTVNWTNMGDALRSVSSREQLLTPYFEDLYDTVDENGTPREDRIDALAYHLNTTRESDYSAIFERPKVMHNDKTGQWVMWWHADGRIEPGGSAYARSMAGVAVSNSPVGPFRMIGAFRMPNRAEYQSCTPSAVPGQARDMTVFKDDDGQAYISYSSEENQSLYVAKLDDTYTNVVHTTDRDTIGVNQYSESGRFPYIFADGTPQAPVRGQDFQIVRECGALESPAIFKRDGTYTVLASGTTGWAPNPQTYYTASSLLGTWIRGIEATDENEYVPYYSIPDGGDGLLSVGDARRTTFGSQATNAFEVEPGKFVFMGDRWNDGEADSTYVWLPLTFGENGRVELHNPAIEDPDRYSQGWDPSYWDDKGFGFGTWRVDSEGIPTSVTRGANASTVLPASVSVDVNGTSAPTAVTWSGLDTRVIGTQKVTGRLAAGNGFTEGRSFQRTVSVTARGVVDVTGEATVSSSTPGNNVERITDGDTASKGWDDWSAAGNPRASWLSFEWDQSKQLDSVAVHTFKDGDTATWPSRIAVQYRNDAGEWLDTTVSTTLEQNAASAAPVAILDLSSLPQTAGLRLDLKTETDTWQSISEVTVWARGLVPNICRTADASVAASFWQTEWANRPAENACDGRDNTSWSTWSEKDLKDSALFSVETPGAHDLDGLEFINIEGSITSVGVEYKNGSGNWLPVEGLTGGDSIVNNMPTKIAFNRVSATGVRITFATPGSFVNIPEIIIPERAPLAPNEVVPQFSSMLDANEAGWYRTPVTVAFDHDGGPGVTVEHRTGPDEAWSDAATIVIATDGVTAIEYRATTDEGTATGLGGTVEVKLDTQTPVTTAETSSRVGLHLPNPTAAAGALAPGTVTFGAVDATSGVAYTEYSTDAGLNWAQGTSMQVAGGGTHVVQFRSVDVAGNVEETRVVTIVIGSDEPTSPTPTPTDPVVAGNIPAHHNGGPKANWGGVGSNEGRALAATGMEVPVTALGVLAALLCAGGFSLSARRRRS